MQQQQPRSARDVFLQGEDGETEGHRAIDQGTVEHDFDTTDLAAFTSHAWSLAPESTAAALSTAATPASVGRPTHSSSASHPSASALHPSDAIAFVQSHAMLLILDFPAGSQFGVDWWSFQVGQAFKGMKMVPRGVHFVWTAASPTATKEASGVLDRDMASRLGSFLWLEGADTWVRRWNPSEEALEAISDESEEHRYVLAARRFQFDSGQGSYPLHARRQWTELTNCITRELVERLEPIDRKIGVSKVNKYAIDDKKPKTPQLEEVDEDAKETPRNAGPAVEDAPMEQARETTASVAAAVTALKPSQSVSASPSSSFYTRIPAVRWFFHHFQQQQYAAADAKAHALTQLHLDQSPILESIFSTSTATSTLASVSLPPEQACAPLLTPSELDLLGELQFAFTAFLIGQDYEGFEAWKSLTRLLTSCTVALERHHVFYEYWLQSVLPAQLSALPRDFFIDGISGDNFLLPSLKEMYDRLFTSVVPESLLVAAAALRHLLQTKFHWRLPLASLLQPHLSDFSPPSSDSHHPVTSSELHEFRRRLLEQEGEYGPTIADDEPVTST